jgi:hypothetical protein
VYSTYNLSSCETNKQLRSPKLPEPSRGRSSYQCDFHLLNPQARRGSIDSQRSQRGDSCRILEVNIVNSLTPRSLVGEGKRLERVLYKHRGHIIPRYASYILPVAAALVLIVLNCKQCYIGGEPAGSDLGDSERFGGWLFAAKLYELLVLASLGMIVFTYNRQEL